MRLLLLLLCFLDGCATTASTLVPSEEPEWLSWPLVEAPLSEPPLESLPVVERPLPPKRLVTKAHKLVGLSTLRVTAPHLPDDCTGLARAVYEDSGINLMGSGVRGDNGVTAMYRLAFERSALHTSAPEPGDLVFFRETYDRNRDGKQNDGLTHVGVVVSVDEDGTVQFVHRIHGGVKRGKLSVEAPLDKSRNDYLRPAKKNATAALTGELFVTFASASRLANAYRAETAILQRPERTERPDTR